MKTKIDRKAYLPDPETIARSAVDIHNENFQHQFVTEDESNRIDRRGGPKLLLLAIVKNAVNTLEEWGRRHDSFGGRAYEFSALWRNARRAYQFLMSEEQDFITRFRSICDVTGLDAEAVRDLIRKRLDEQAVQALFNRPARKKGHRLAHT